MPTYVVTGFQNGSFRTIETRQQSVSAAISHAESLGVEPETVRCAATREVFRKEGKEWTVDRYLPPKKIGGPGEHTLLYVASFVVPLVGLGVGGFRAYCGLSGGRGALICGCAGLIAWGIGYVVISAFL